MYCYLPHIVDETQSAYQIERDCSIARNMRQGTSRPRNEANKDRKKRGDSVYEPAYDRSSAAIGNNQTITIRTRTLIFRQSCEEILGFIRLDSIHIVN